MDKIIVSIFLSLFIGCVMISTTAIADTTTSYKEGYGTHPGKKLGTGVSNLATGWVEVPKNTLNVTNHPDTKYVLFGIVGGTIKGILHMAGRTLTGVVDVLTFPLPTKPTVNSGLVWEKFGEDTTYGPYIVLEDQVTE